eukprot:scaffold215578_cov29-Tisochrysis_lutea.AAC.2
MASTPATSSTAACDGASPHRIENTLSWKKLTTKRGVKRAAVQARSSVCHRLFERQTDVRAAMKFEKRSVKQRFCGLRPRVAFDIYTTAGSRDEADLEVHRSSIVEIVVAGGLIFGLDESGICVAFDMDTGRRVCTLNLSSREVIRSVFHNKMNQSLIVVAVMDSDQYTSLRCRSWCVLTKAFALLAREAGRPLLSIYWRQIYDCYPFHRCLQCPRGSCRWES